MLNKQILQLHCMFGTYYRKTKLGKDCPPYYYLNTSQVLLDVVKYAAPHTHEPEEITLVESQLKQLLELIPSQVRHFE